jgi:hypothetical protein
MLALSSRDDPGATRTRRLRPISTTVDQIQSKQLVNMGSDSGCGCPCSVALDPKRLQGLQMFASWTNSPVLRGNEGV